ncbi:MAG: SCO family protein [Verrucomicrobiae bacterium]|nr:SCO family protein [Verrucomicrobiae bacterium]NNJ44211.1 SCO family protein [Akkermansiaceae bacterium]
MNDKTKIICIYVVVAVISVLILATTYYIRGRQVKPELEAFYERETHFAPLLKLEKDLVLTNQAGKEVRISDLKGKVWAFAQFYASCPMCAQRNSQGLKKLYETFKGEADFQLVCITVNPETDGVAEMKAYAEGLDADTSNWWFLTGDPEALKAYMIEQMKYQPIVQRADPEEAAEKGDYEHDMSIAVYDRNLSMVQRHDLFNARKKGEAYFNGEENKLHYTVKTLLEKK